MQIVIKLEQKDFEGNKDVFDRMYSLSEVVNRRTDSGITKAEVERSAGVVREPEPVPTQSEDEPTDAAAPVPTEDYTLEQVRKAFADLSKAKGKDAAKGILTDMGCSRVPDLPPDKYAEAMTRIEAVK